VSASDSRALRSGTNPIQEKTMFQTPSVKSLDAHLVLKHATVKDAPRLNAFNAMIFDPYVGAQTEAMMLHHPTIHPENFIYIEDESTGQIVSCLCLLPWRWLFDEIELKMGEMAIVGTQPEYRRRGLVRALVNHFKECLAEDEYDLSFLGGIPYYYRQFGYEYALPLEGYWHLPLYQIPFAAENAPAYTFRDAAPDDIPTLMEMYEVATRDLNISTVREAEVWRYQIEHKAETDSGAYTLLMTDPSGKLAGYVRLKKFGVGSGLIVCEASQFAFRDVPALFQRLKEIALECGKDSYIRFALPPSAVLTQAAKAWGAQFDGYYAWQIHIPDIARLLRRMISLFERRIAASPFAGLTQKVRINLYRQAYEIIFDNGTITAVNSMGFQDWPGMICIPPNAFTQLVMGYRTSEELREIFPDIMAWGESRTLLAVFFPKTNAFIYMIY
jgi:predicted N-acetyltransferase YhbS